MDSGLSSFVSPAEPAGCPRMVIDLRVTKQSRHGAPDQTMHMMHQPLLQEHPKEWSLSRNEVPYALAHKGFMMHDWTNVFDEACTLWEKRSVALREVIMARETPLTLSPAVGGIIFTVIFSYFFAFNYFFGWVNTFTNLALLWLFCLILICFLPFIFVSVMFTTGNGESLTMYSGKMFETLAEFEGDWSRLADEQRCIFQSFGVDVVPIREVTTTRGLCHVWTVGLRFSFAMRSASHKEDCWPMLSNVPASAASVHDLDRLLQLNQTGDVETKLYQLLKSRILSETSMPSQYKS